MSRLFGGRLQIVLIASFSLIAALTVGLNALAISRVIENYLEQAQDRRVARDMELANAFYQLKQDKVDGLAQRIALDTVISDDLRRSMDGDEVAFGETEKSTNWHASVSNMVGTYWINILDRDGEIFYGITVPSSGEVQIVRGGSWAKLPIVADSLAARDQRSGTEVIPVEFLSLIGLGEQARIRIKDTPRAAPEPFDDREGTAGLAVVSVNPLENQDRDVIGAVVVGHLFNNDFTLVDRIREVAGVDTVTIFFGDLRVSTNVPDEQGERAVGTLVSQEVRDVVLEQGLPYKGEAFVVNELFITRYEPLRNYAHEVVGSLYVGARLSTFQQLVQDVIGQVGIVTLVSILLAILIAIPIAHLITRPISALMDATRRLAEGDMTVRVDAVGRGELAVLSRSFNSMVDTLHATQQELLHKEKLASMGQLSAGVAHEINNPLGTIQLLAGVLRDETALNETQREDLEMIINETTRCKRIVSDLLNFARQQEVLAQPTDLNAMLDDVLDTASILPIFDKIEIVRDYGELPVVQADPSQLRQVFTNLVRNAAEAMNGYGTLRLETRKVDDQWVEVRVEDTGVGIPSVNQAKVFTPFFTTKSHGKGTGLGLSIAYGIVKMHRGQISVKSAEGEGTTFTILLPVQPFRGSNDSG
ncbi:MAG: cache domain-containing protein [Anaerolineales bacterium]|nr:cache domain-containing protein [Anaerolineales bacterium]